MPAFFALISFTLPAGIVLYFFVSNLYRIGQQAFITRTMYHEGGALATTGTESAAPAKKAHCPPRRRPCPNAAACSAS